MCGVPGRRAHIDPTCKHHCSNALLVYDIQGLLIARLNGRNYHIGTMAMFEYEQYHRKRIAWDKNLDLRSE